jgi:hypothetical protein
VAEHVRGLRGVQLVEHEVRPHEVLQRRVGSLHGVLPLLRGDVFERELCSGRMPGSGVSLQHGGHAG